MSTLVVTDLDRTLIYSRAAFELSCADADAPNLVTAEFYLGAPLSYLTLTSAELLRALPTGALLPATTRTVEQYLRIRLPGSVPRFAVTSNGGNIVRDGRPDPQWRAGVAAAVADSAPLDVVHRRLAEVSDQDWVRSVRTADDLFTYLVAQTPDLPDGFTDELAAWTAERGWRVSVQGRKVYLLPGELRKSVAVQHVRDLLGADRLLAAGDGILDADVLELADAAIRPRHGELHDQGFTLPHLRITDASGILAGQEMVCWYSQQLAAT